MKNRRTTIILFFITHCAMSQDIHFSELPVAAICSNPANTGYFEGNWRVSDLYRNQYDNFSAPFSTSFIGFDKQFNIKNEQINGGVFYINDISSQNTLMTNQFFVTTSYHLKISDYSTLSMGIQGGIITKKSDNRGLSLPEQYDITTGMFNAVLPSVENLNYEKNWYPDLGAGIFWRYKKKYCIEIGSSIYHINKPAENLLNTNHSIPWKYVIQGGVGISLSHNLIMKPRIVYVQFKQASEINSGAGFIYQLNYFTNLSAGFYFRNGLERNTDAFIIATGAVIKNWAVGLSYDLDISKLHNITGKNNAIELSVIYTRPSTNFKAKNTPCFLY